MNLTDKKEVVERWKDIFQQAAVVLLADYTGIKANEIAQLRRNFRSAGVEFRVVKNTLARRALEGSSYPFLGETFRGPVAVIAGVKDPIAPAKILMDAAKKFDKLKVLGGGLQGRPLDKAGVEMLAKMPGMNELRASFLGLLNNVPGGFVRLLNAVPGGLVNVLDARRRKLEEAA